MSDRKEEFTEGFSELLKSDLIMSMQAVKDKEILRIANLLNENWVSSSLDDDCKNISIVMRIQLPFIRNERVADTILRFISEEK